MRITFVMTAYPPGSSAEGFREFGICQNHQARALVARGHEVTVVTRSTEDAQTERYGVRYCFVADGLPTTLRFFQSSAEVVKQVKRSAPDVVHCHGFSNAVFMIRLRHALGRKIPILAEHHGEPALRFPANYLQRAVLRRLSGLIFSNSQREQHWRRWLGVSGQRVFHAAECAPDRFFENRAEARKRTGFAGDPVILWNSRAIARRHPVLVVKAYESYLHQTPDARCHFYMMIPDHGPGILSQLQDLQAGSPKLRAHLTLIAERRPQAELTDFYNSADFILSGSEDDPYGYGVVDGMACGLIPIVPRSPSFLDITEHGRLGHLWDLADPDTLVEAFKAMPQGQDRIAQEAQRVLEHFENRLSMAAQGAALEQAYLGAMPRA